MNNEELRAKLKDWFADSYRKEQFRCSMGEIQLHQQSMLTVIHFLAQGVALLAYYDQRYCDQIVQTHEGLRSMTKTLELLPGGKSDVTYQFATIIGSIIELAGKALHDIVKD